VNDATGQDATWQYIEIANVPFLVPAAVEFRIISVVPFSIPGGVFAFP